MEALEHYGYPQWYRVVTGSVEMVAGLALVVGPFTAPLLALAGSLDSVGVWTAAVLTHVRIDDPISTAAIPAVLLVPALAVAVSYGGPYLT